MLWVGAIGGAGVGAAWAAGRARAWVRGLPAVGAARASPGAGGRGRAGLNVEEDGVVEIHDLGEEGGGESGEGGAGGMGGGLEDVLLSSGRMREFDFEGGGSRRLSPDELVAERDWWRGLPVVSVLVLGLGERGGEPSGLFSVDVSFTGEGAENRALCFEDPEDALKLQNALRALPGFYSDCAAVKMSPLELLSEMEGDPDRLVVMRAGRIDIRPGTGPAEVAEAVANEYYFRQVLGIVAPPGVRPS